MGYGIAISRSHQQEGNILGLLGIVELDVHVCSTFVVCTENEREDTALSTVDFIYVVHLCRSRLGCNEFVCPDRYITNVHMYMCPWSGTLHLVGIAWHLGDGLTTWIVKGQKRS